MAAILAIWRTQDEVFPGAETINHFGIKLKDTAGTVIDDASEPLDRRTHLFVDVAPGDYFVEAQSYNADETLAGGPIMSAPVSVTEEAANQVIVELTASQSTGVHVEPHAPK
jgi:hypothetical protein